MRKLILLGFIVFLLCNIAYAAVNYNPDAFILVDDFNGTGTPDSKDETGNHTYTFNDAYLSNNSLMTDSADSEAYIDTGQSDYIGATSVTFYWEVNYSEGGCNGNNDVTPMLNAEYATSRCAAANSAQVYDGAGFVAIGTYITDVHYYCYTTIESANSKYNFSCYRFDNDTLALNYTNGATRSDSDERFMWVMRDDRGHYLNFWAIWEGGIADEPDGLRNTTAPGAPPGTNFTIYAVNSKTSASITNFSAVVGGVFYTTTNASIVTGYFVNATQLYNVTISSHEGGGYYNHTYLNQNISTDLNANLAPYYSFDYTLFQDVVTYNATLNLTRRLNYTLNYTCPSLYSANIEMYIGDNLTEVLTSTCTNTSRQINGNYTHYTEEHFNISFKINTTHLPLFNNASTNRTEFLSDLYNASIADYNISFYDGFSETGGNVSLRCVDNIFTPLHYNISFNGHYVFNDNVSNNTNQIAAINLTSGTNTLNVGCFDLFGGETLTYQETIYYRQIWIIDERENTAFDYDNVSSLIVYFDDNSTSYDFKTDNSTSVNFTSSSTNRLRFEIGYPNGDIITRYVDVTLDNGDLRVCANKEGVSHYEQLILSASQNPVSLRNVYSNCVIAEDYTRFAYQDSYILKAYTIDSLYYLYTYDDGSRVYLSSMDGSISTYYNIDVLEFNAQAYELDVGGDVLSFYKYTNQTIQIYFRDILNDSVSTYIEIERLNTSDILFSTTDTTSPNQFFMYFDFSTYSLDENEVLRISVTTRTAGGAEETTSKYFNTQASSGTQSTGFMFVVSILLTIFGLTLTHVRLGLGWFGILTQLSSIIVLSLAVTAWYTILLMSVNVIILVYIILLFNQQNYAAVV